jgi:hypothetical protein
MHVVSFNNGCLFISVFLGHLFNLFRSENTSLLCDVTHITVSNKIVLEVGLAHSLLMEFWRHSNLCWTCMPFLLIYGVNDATRRGNKFLESVAAPLRYEKAYHLYSPSHSSWKDKWTCQIILYPPRVYVLISDLQREWLWRLFDMNTILYRKDTYFDMIEGNVRYCYCEFNLIFILILVSLYHIEIL